MTRRGDHQLPWTETEDNILRETCNPSQPQGCLKDAAARLGRTHRATRERARHLGLANRHRPMGERTMAALRKRIEVSGAYSRYNLTEDQAKELLEDFKKSIYPLGVFARRRGYPWRERFVEALRVHLPGEYDAVIEEKAGRRDLKYKKGRAFEYRIRDDLRRHKYWVLRSPQSRSVLDLVAIKKGSILLVQCKLNQDLGLDERRQLVELADSLGARAILARRRDGRGIWYKECLADGYAEWVFDEEPQ